MAHHVSVIAADHKILQPSLTHRFLLGPTVNDALANVGKTSTDEISERYGQIGFQWKHEYEADLVGLRSDLVSLLKVHGSPAGFSHWQATTPTLR